MTTLVLETLEPASFEPYGRIVEMPATPAHAEGPGWRWWGEVSQLDGNGRAWGVGYLDLRPAPLVFDWAERHMRSAEAIFAVAGDIAVYVGPAEHPEQPDRIPDRDRFHAFRVPRGSGVVLNPGVWHGAPFALGAEGPAIVLLLAGTGSDDVTVVRFEQDPVHVTVV